MMRRLRIFLILFSLTAALCACAPREPALAERAGARRAEAVPYPHRPDFPVFVNGDFAALTQEARERLAKRHTLVVWYLKELEAALAAYDMQTGPASPAP